MNLQKLTTDELIEKVLKAGVPLPTYDYNNYRKYLISIPHNEKIGNCVIGIQKSDMYDSFREACIAIIIWYNSI